MEALRKLVATRVMRRGALLIGALAVVAVMIAGIDLQLNLARVKVAMLSGSEGGNYHAIVAQLSAEARSGRGQIGNLTTQGSIDNIERLSAARRTCHAQFALVQDGLECLLPTAHVQRLEGGDEAGQFGPILCARCSEVGARRAISAGVIPGRNTGPAPQPSSHGSI